MSQFEILQATNESVYNIVNTFGKMIFGQEPKGLLKLVCKHVDGQPGPECLKLYDWKLVLRPNEGGCEDAVSKLDGQGLIISSSSNQYDFVSRYFCPKYGIDEDPVTGSAHTTLIPYWSEKLNKISLTAKQVSKRGGELFCENTDNRVLIGGNAVLYMKGVIEID